MPEGNPGSVYSRFDSTSGPGDDSSTFNFLHLDCAFLRIARIGAVAVTLIIWALPLYNTSIGLGDGGAFLIAPLPTASRLRGACAPAITLTHPTPGSFPRRLHRTVRGGRCALLPAVLCCAASALP
jgi:hypothetical protein